MGDVDLPSKADIFCYFLVVKSKVTNIGAELDFSSDGGVD